MERSAIKRRTGPKPPFSCGTDGEEHAHEPAPAGSDYAAGAINMRTTPMRLILMELAMNDKAVAQRTLIAACSGGLVTLYEVHAPAWHAALCADRLDWTGVTVG